MNTEEAFKVYQNVISKYCTAAKTQQEIADELGISVEAVRWCTQYCGFHHTKAKNGKAALAYLDEFNELCKLL